ncbi:MAG TPA: SRPBCC family protein [Flavobacterium sp.]|jgi:uncharacterized protein YndB with AHSA1/START domain
MKIFLWIIGTLVAIIVIILIIAAFTNKQFTLKREVIINRPKQQVFDYIKLQKNQEQYSKWAMADPSMNKSYRNTDGTVGFLYAWDSNDKNVGKGEQEITSISEGEKVSCEIRFEKPMKGVSHTTMTTEALSENQTKVTWLFHSQMSYPMNAMMLFVSMDKMLGTDMETSLTNLKKILDIQ